MLRMALMMSVLVVLLLGSEVARAQRHSNRRPVAATTTLAPVAFTSEESACFQKKKVRYSVDGQCYDLVTKGPCASGQWLVLDLQEAINGTGALRAVCRRCPCCDHPLKLYWPPASACRKRTEKLCMQPGTEAVNDVFGEGECACISDPPHLRYELHARNDSIEQCYQLYTRGPCMRRQILVAQFIPNLGRVAKCVSDPCYRQNDRDGWHALHSDGLCYKLRTRGPCVGEELFRVREDTLRVACVGDANALWEMEKRCMEQPEGQEDCPAEIKANTIEQHEANMWEMASQIPKKRRKVKKSFKG